TIEECVGIAHELGLGDVHLDAHGVRARLRRRIADRGAGRYRTGLIDRTGARQKLFQERCLATGERADDGNASWARSASVLAHVTSLGRTTVDGSPLPTPAGVEGQSGCGTIERRHRNSAAHAVPQPAGTGIVSGVLPFGKSIAFPAPSIRVLFLSPS